MHPSWRIVMIASRFPPFIGGAERQCLNLSVSLSGAGHKVDVLTERAAFLPENENIHGVTVHRLFAYPASIRFLANTSFFFALLTYFLKNSKTIEIVHSHVATAAALYGSILSKLFGKKSLVKFTGSGVTGEINTSSASLIGKIKLKLLMFCTDRYVCPDVRIKDELIAAGFPENRIDIIYNGVDTVFFAPRENRRNDVPVAVFVGRLELVKNLAVLLEAWKIATEGIKARLLIIGEGSQKENLVDKTKELKLTGSVIFTGKAENVREHLLSSDIFILPSIAEGLSNSLLEAMSCGLAPIASRAGGNPLIIEENTSGLLFDPADTCTLAAHLRRLLTDEGLRKRIGGKARERVLAGYSIEKIRDEYIKLYETL